MLQETLRTCFNKELKKHQCVFNWYVRDLKKFSRPELFDLNSTCIAVREFETDKDIIVLTKKVQAKIGDEIARRHLLELKPKIKVKRNKGNNNAR